MPSLNPYFYVDGNTWYTTGMPKSKKSAIFTGFAGWAMAPIFKNPENYDIKITAIKGLFGVSTGSASAVAICGSLNGEGNPEYVWPGNVSNAFNIPVQSVLTTWSNPGLTSNPVISAGSFFYAGFKFARNNNTYSYLNVARSNCRNNARFRPFYNAQSLGNKGNPGAGAGLTRIAANDTWGFQVPIIVVEYEPNKIKPSVSQSSIILTQGSTGYINIGNYSGWWANEHNNSVVDLRKNGNQLQIYAKYFIVNYDYNTSVVVHGLNDETWIKVYINRPEIYGPNISTNEALRPTEQAYISCSASDNQSVDLSLSNTEYAKLDNLTITCKEVESATSWPDNTTITVNAAHSKNNTVKSSTTFKIKHWPTDTIKFTTAGSSLFSDKGSFINFVDSSPAALDRCEIKVNIIYDGGSRLHDKLVPKYLKIIKDKTGAGKVEVISDEFSNYIDDIKDKNPKLQFVLRLKKDYVVSKTFNTNISVIKTVEFNCIYPKNPGDKTTINYMSTNTLPLFANSVKNGKYEVNYSNYPIVIMYPNKGNGNLYIHNTFLYTINNGSANTGYIFKNHDANYKVSLSHFCNSSLLKPGSELWIALNLENRFISCKPGNTLNITFSLDVPKLDDSGTEVRTITIKYKVYYDNAGESILPFITGNYKYTDPKTETETELSIQGSPFRTNHVDIINTLSNPITQVLQAYGQITNDVDNIISAKQNEYVCNATDKAKIENLLSKLSILIRNINTSSNRYIDDIRSEIALGQYIMWNDNEDKLANDEPNVFKSSTEYATKTASPWYELYRGLRYIQFGKEVEVFYKDSNTDYQVSYRDSDGKTYDLGARR